METARTEISPRSSRGMHLFPISFPIHWKVLLALQYYIQSPFHCLSPAVRSMPSSSFSWIIVTVSYSFPCGSPCLSSLFSCRVIILDCVTSVFTKLCSHNLVPCSHLTSFPTASSLLLHSSHSGFFVLP